MPKGLKMKVKSNMWDEASGSIKDFTFAKAGGGYVMKNKIMTNKSNTPAQQKIRSYTTLANSRWKTLTIEQRAKWGDYAKTFHHVDPLGNKIKMTDWNCYLSMFVILSTDGKLPEQMPKTPDINTMYDKPILNLSITTATDTVPSVLQARCENYQGNTNIHLSFTNDMNSTINNYSGTYVNKQILEIKNFEEITIEGVVPTNNKRLFFKAFDLNAHGIFHKSRKFYFDMSTQTTVEYK
jgi:hypothetical protein